MTYRCLRCGYGQNAHDTNLTFNQEQILLLSAESLQDGFEMTLVDCTLSPRPADYMAEVARLCDGKTPVQAFGIGAGYVSPDITAEYAEELAWLEKNRGMWPQAELFAVIPCGPAFSISG